MGQPTKRYSTQDVWKSYWCGPTIFDRIGKDFDKSGYDLHWLRDALTSDYDVHTLSVLEKARLLCDAQDNRQASSIGIVDIAVLALSCFAVLASVISTYKDMNISQEIMPANLMLLIGLIVLFAILMGEAIHLFRRDNRRDRLREALAILIAEDERTAKEKEQASDEELRQLIHNLLAISVQAASAVSDNSAAGGTADADADADADAGNDDGDGDA